MTNVEFYKPLVLNVIYQGKTHQLKYLLIVKLKRNVSHQVINLLRLNVY